MTPWHLAEGVAFEVMRQRSENASVVIRGGSADFDEIGFPRRSRPLLIVSRPVTPTAAAICPLKATDWQLRPSIPKEPTRNPAGSSVHFLFEA